MMDRDSLLTKGREFHAGLEAAKAEHGSPLPTHPDDAEHDLAVGYALHLAVREGDEAAVGFYNAWAGQNGYAAIHALGYGLIDIIDAVVRITPTGVEIVECR